VEGTGSRNSSYIRTADGFELRTDTPKQMGGSNTAAQPVYMLLSALIGCETATANFVARQMKFRIRDIRFRLSAWRDERGAISLPLEVTDHIPSQLQVVKGEAVVDTDATQEQLTTLGHHVHKRCPIASMLVNSGCKLDISWVKA